MLAVSSGLHGDFASAQVIWNKGLFAQAGEREGFPFTLDRGRRLVLPCNKSSIWNGEGTARNGRKEKMMSMLFIILHCSWKKSIQILSLIFPLQTLFNSLSFFFFSVKSNVFPNCADAMEVTIVPGLKRCNIYRTFYDFSLKADIAFLFMVLAAVYETTR